MKVYLAGPIFGCTDDEAINWRDVVKNKLGADKCIDPMRRDYRGRETNNAQAIVESDKRDICEADIVLANCWQVSWGTAMEILYAYSLGKPVIAILPLTVGASPWISYHTTIVRSLDAAIHYLTLPSAREVLRK
jgi:nucleoside 2-deoxyribosyltransferase